jgi:hypothetical protein
MASDPPREVRENTVTASFDRPDLAEAAIARLRELGIGDLVTSSMEGRTFLTFNAGPHEQDARLILRELGAEMRNRPG